MEEAQPELGHGQVLQGGPPVPGCRLLEVLPDSCAELVFQAKGITGGSQILIGGLPQPDHGLLPVLRRPVAQVQELGQGELGLGIARLRQFPDFPRIVIRGRAAGVQGAKADQRKKEQNTPDRPVQNWYGGQNLAKLAKSENADHSLP